MSNLATALKLKAELDALRPLTADQEQRIWQKFRFDWNYHSNNIEGNSLTFGETKSLLLHNITAQGKPLKDHIEITGHNEAINALLDLTRGDTPLTESFFRSLHTLILRERYRVNAQTPDGKPTKKWVEVGQYKTAPNHVLTVTGETFRFAEPVDVADKMQKLVQEVNGIREITDAEALVAAAKIHYDFVLIHPFDDGNGRMARLLMNLVLIKFGFPPAIIRTEDKANYFAALRQADGGQLNVFFEYVAGCVCASLKTMLAGARGESIEESDEQGKQIKLLARLLEEGKPRITVSRSVEVLKILFEQNFERLARSLHHLSMEFSNLYVESQFAVGSRLVGDSDIELTQIMQRIKDAITDTTSDLTINGAFSNLRYKGLESFSYHWGLRINCAPTNYVVSASFPEALVLAVKPLSKFYDETLTASEFEMLRQAVFSQHMSAIETASGVRLSALLT